MGNCSCSAVEEYKTGRGVCSLKLLGPVHKAGGLVAGEVKLQPPLGPLLQHVLDPSALVAGVRALQLVANGHDCLCPRCRRPSLHSHFGGGSCVSLDDGLLDRQLLPPRLIVEG